MSRKVDYLDEDTHLPEGQNYVCISFLGDPENKLTLKGIKIRGVFPDYDMACKFAKATQNKDVNSRSKKLKSAVNDLYAGTKVEPVDWVFFELGSDAKAEENCPAGHRFALNDCCNRYAAVSNIRDH